MKLELKVPQVIMDPTVILELRELLVIMVTLELKVQEVIQELKVQQVIMDLMVILELKVK